MQRPQAYLRYARATQHQPIAAVIRVPLLISFYLRHLTKAAKLSARVGLEPLAEQAGLEAHRVRGSLLLATSVSRCEAEAEALVRGLFELGLISKSGKAKAPPFNVGPRLVAQLAGCNALAARQVEPQTLCETLHLVETLAGHRRMDNATLARTAPLEALDRSQRPGYFVAAGT